MKMIGFLYENDRFLKKGYLLDEKLHDFMVKNRRGKKTDSIIEFLTNVANIFATTFAVLDKSIIFVFDMTSHASRRTAHLGRSSSFYIVS